MYSGTSSNAVAADVVSELVRIALSDAPAVLGWQAWREFEARYGLIAALLENARADGSMTGGSGVMARVLNDPTATCQPLAESRWADLSAQPSEPGRRSPELDRTDLGELHGIVGHLLTNRPVTWSLSHGNVTDRENCGAASRTVGTTGEAARRAPKWLGGNGGDDGGCRRSRAAGAGGGRR
ncbi:hypothetical protein [Nocardia sp. NBC_01499]|uniref:hypothetical protein n=1 Tax=Nocardia sp. NBC_01499 TaxID=2903597 RepID=UPI00386F9035